MSNQNFKMILTGPISSMGDVVNCVAGHGGKIEMVEIEETAQAAPELTTRKRSKGSHKHVVKVLDVYKALTNPTIVEKSANGIARYLAHALGEDVKASAVSTHLWKMRKAGVIELVSSPEAQTKVYAVKNSGVAPETAIRHVLDWQKSEWQK